MVEWFKLRLTGRRQRDVDKNSDASYIYIRRRMSIEEYKRCIDEKRYWS